MPPPVRQRPGPVPGHSQQSNRVGHIPHGQKKDDISELLRDTENYFKSLDPDTRPNNRLDSPQFTEHALYKKLDAVFQAKKPGLVELEMMETFRAWIEDQKGDDYHRFQTFEFIFSTALKDSSRFNFLTSLLSFAISTYSTKLLEVGALWMKIQNKEYSIKIADQILVDFSHAIPVGGDLLHLHQSCPRFAAMLISTWGEKYKFTASVPPELVLQIITAWLESDSTIIFTPLLVRNTIWLSFVKPQHFTPDYINICGAVSAIAWSIRLAFLKEGKQSAQFHWLILKCISQADKVGKRMAKNFPIHQNYKIWARQDVHSLIGEIKEKAKEADFKSQVDKSGNAIENSKMQTAVNRFAQISQAAKFSGALKDCSESQFQALSDILPKTKLLTIVSGI